MMRSYGDCLKVVVYYSATVLTKRVVRHIAESFEVINQINRKFKQWHLS